MRFKQGSGDRENLAEIYSSGSNAKGNRVEIKRWVMPLVILLLITGNGYQFLTQWVSNEEKVVYESRPMTDQQVVNRFHQIFYENGNTHWLNRWLGVSTLQNPNDAWMVQEIISEIKPDFVVEAGTYHGGSAALWAMVLEQVNPSGRVISIDIEDRSETARKLRICQERVDFIIGSSTDPSIVEQVKQRTEGGTVLVILDSAHNKSHVLEEMNLYAPLVSPGSYLLVQDSNVNGHPVKPDYGPGPMEALEEFLEDNEGFEIDRNRERLLFTMHPRGYIKRLL